MKFKWFYLIPAIIFFAITAQYSKIGKWIFILVMLGILLAFGGKILPK